MNKRPTIVAMLAAVLVLQVCTGAVAGGGKPVEYRAEREALFAHDGRPSKAARRPPPGFLLRTLAGLYASPAQMLDEVRSAELYTVVIDIDPSRPLAPQVEQTVALHRWTMANTLQGAATAYFVRALTHQQAVTAADELSRAGVSLVFVVVNDQPAR